MIGDNCPAHMTLTAGSRSCPTMPSDNANGREYVPGSRAEYHREYNRTHKKSHQRKEAKA